MDKNVFCWYYYIEYNYAVLELGPRIILCFTLCQIIFYPMFFRYNIVKNKKIVILSILLYTSLIFMKILILGNQGDYSVYPYKTILW